MEARDFFLAAHARLHSAGVAEAEGGSVADRVLGGLTDEQMRVRPGAVNSLAWLLWHVARAEDAVVNLVIAGHGQVFDQDGWPGRLGVGRRDIGTGMTGDEVGALTARLDIGAARAYRDAVGRRTREIVGRPESSALAGTTSQADVGRALEAGALAPNAGWVAEFWTGRTRAGLLAANSITHTSMHLGEALTVRSLAGLGGGR